MMDIYTKINDLENKLKEDIRLLNNENIKLKEDIKLVNDKLLTENNKLN